MLRPLQVLHSTFSINIHPPIHLTVSYHSMVVHRAVSCNDTGLVPKPKTIQNGVPCQKRWIPNPEGDSTCNLAPTPSGRPDLMGNFVTPRKHDLYVLSERNKKMYISSVQTTEQYILRFASQDLMGRFSPENNFWMLKIATLAILTDP